MTDNSTRARDAVRQLRSERELLRAAERERDTLRAKVAAVEALADDWGAGAAPNFARALRDALDSA